jgi:hypothetical protein
MNSIFVLTVLIAVAVIGIIHSAVKDMEAADAYKAEVDREEE